MNGQKPRSNVLFSSKCEVPYYGVGHQSSISRFRNRFALKYTNRFSTFFLVGAQLYYLISAQICAAFLLACVEKYIPVPVVVVPEVLAPARPKAIAIIYVVRREKYFNANSISTARPVNSYSSILSSYTCRHYPNSNIPRTTARWARV